MKKLLCLLLAMIIAVSFITPVMADSNIKVKLDGKQIEFDVQPQAINSRTMVPLRAIFEALGATVDWDGETQTVTSTKGETTITLTIDSNKMRVNNKQVILDSPACAIDGRTLVPVRAVSEAYGLEVNWNQDTQTVELSSPKTEEEKMNELLNAYSGSQKVCISGSLAGVDWTGGTQGSLIIKDKASGAVKYQTQFTADEKGKYELNFDFAESLASCNIVVKEGENIVTSGVKTAYTETASTTSVFLRDKDGSGSIEPEEFSEVASKLDSTPNDGGEYKVLVVFYAKGGKFMSYQTVSEGKYGLATIRKTVKIPQDAAMIKALLCGNIRTNIAVSDNAEKPKTSDKKFGGDSGSINVAFIGDSITIQNQYLKGIEHYYHTRYPNKEIVFINKGIGGHQTKDVIARFDWDIAKDDIAGSIDEATILLGMNDLVVVPMTGSVKATYMTDESIQKQKREDFLKNMQTLINLCKEAGIKLTIVTSSLYDDTEGFGRANSQPYAYGVNAILGEGMEALKELAKANNVQVIDLWTTTTEVTDYVRKEHGEIGAVVTGTDRIHPGEQGGLYMAYQIAKQQDGNPIVAKVSIDVVARTANADNASVSLMSTSSTGVKYSYLANAIPFACTKDYKKFEEWGVPITKDINQEIIKVSGLEMGTYKITIDGTPLTKTYSASELAEGVNIAIDENNPAQIQAQKAFELAKVKCENEQSYRGIARTEIAFLTKNYSAEYFGDNPTKEQLAVLGTSTSFVHYFSTDPDNYGSKKYAVENWAKLRQQEQAARDAAKPVKRTVVIEKQ